LPMNYPIFPSFVPLGPEYSPSLSLQPYPLAAHQDFSSIVTRSRPARRGEIIHFYMTGLGPVSPPVAAGVAAPSGPPAVVTTPLSCRFSATGVTRPAEVLFAGLAPGLTGYYQVSIPLPEDVFVENGEVFLSCFAATDYTGSTVEIPVLVRPCPSSHGATIGTPDSTRCPAEQK
jgi:uncharacterized protein (TIGR03437 family)